MPRPAVAFAMLPWLRGRLVLDEHLEALSSFADVVDPQPLASFDDDRAAAVLPRAEVLITGWECPPVTAAVLDRAPELRLVAHAAGTIRHVATGALWDRGVRVVSAAAANAIPTAEYAVAMILLANKGVPWLRDRFRQERTTLLAFADDDAGNLGKRVGVIGASRVGRLVIAALQRHDLEVVVADPTVTGEVLGAPVVDLDTLLATSDLVSVHAPLLPETTGLLGAAELARMRDGAVLVNTARGAIVDTGALEAELVSGRLRAVLDVTEPEPLPDGSPLWELPNVFLTPHMAGSTGRELRRLTDLVIDEVRRFAAGEALRHEVTRAQTATMA